MLLEQCTKFSSKIPNINILTIHDFSIVTISEFMLLANRCMNPNVYFLIVASKLLIPKLAYIALALHPHGWLRTRRYALLISTRITYQILTFFYAVHK